MIYSLLNFCLLGVGCSCYKLLFHWLVKIFCIHKIFQYVFPHKWWYLPTQVMGSKTKIYIVLEFVTGGELFDKIVRLEFSLFSSFYQFYMYLGNKVFKMNLEDLICYHNLSDWRFPSGVTLDGNLALSTTGIWHYLLNPGKSWTNAGRWSEEIFSAAN